MRALPGIARRAALFPCLLGALLLGLAACGGNQVRGDTGQIAATEAPQPGPEFAARITAARRASRNCGTESFPAVGPVRWSPRLAAAARDQSSHLARTGRLSHTGAGGSSLADRIGATGYRPRAWAENVASGQRSAAAVVDAWLESPGHCRNIMNGAYSEIGAAAVRGGDGRLYWTLVLAAPRQ